MQVTTLVNPGHPDVQDFRITIFIKMVKLLFFPESSFEWVWIENESVFWGHCWRIHTKFAWFIEINNAGVILEWHIPPVDKSSWCWQRVDNKSNRLILVHTHFERFIEYLHSYLCYYTANECCKESMFFVSHIKCDSSKHNPVFNGPPQTGNHINVNLQSKRRSFRPCSK